MLDVPGVAATVLGGRLEHERHVAPLGVVEDAAEPVVADVAVADVGVFVFVGAAVVFRVVEVDAVEMLGAHDVVELSDRLVDALRRREVIARGERVSGVQTDADISLGALDHPGEMLELAAEFGAAAGVALDQDFDAIGDVERVDDADSVLNPAVDARASVGAEVDVDVLDVETVGGVDLLLHGVAAFLAEPLLGRTEIHEIRGVDDPRPGEFRRGFVAELFGRVVLNAAVVPHLWGVGKHLPAVAADVELAADRVVDAACDGDVRPDSEHGRGWRATGKRCSKLSVAKLRTTRIE